MKLYGSKWISFKEFIAFRGTYSSYMSLREHIESTGNPQKYFIKFLLFTSLIPIIRDLPILSRLCSIPQKILRGYMAESSIEFNPIAVNSAVPSSDLESEVYDYIIIGSGPGAATSIQHIPRGSRVLIIEKGDYPRTPETLHHTFYHILFDFEKGGGEFILARHLPQFAQGSVVGGGSEVNSGLYHRLPSSKIPNYLKASALSETEWHSSEKEVEDFLKIQSSPADEERSLIANSAKKLGLQFMNVPRWRHYEDSMTYKHFGMLDLVWNDLKEEENRILLSNVKVTHFSTKQKNFIQVYATHRNGYPYTFKSRQLIVSAGAVRSPFLLAKSHLISWKEVNFQWHPMIRRFVSTEKNLLGYGDIDPFQAWTDDYRFKFGSAVSTPGLIAAGLNSSPAPEEFGKLRSYYVSFVSTGRGGLVPGTAIPWYKYSKEDMENLSLGQTSLEKFLKSSEIKLVGEKHLNLSTVHVFGSLPIGSDIYHPGTNVLRRDDRVIVADSSLLPEGPGANPQGPTMTLVNALLKGGI